MEDLEKEPLFEGLRQMISGTFLKSKLNWDQVNLSHGEIIVPNFPAMQKIADHYKQKYKILIEFCNYDEFILELSRFSESTEHSKQPFGLIAMNKSDRSLHATPFLVDCRSKVICNFDVLGIKSTYYKSAAKASEKLGFKYFAHVYTRQATGYECRIDALVFLRNALISLDASQNFVELFPDIEKKLPPQWGYTDQITPSTLKDLKNLILKVPRDLQNKKLDKSEDPETLLDFRKRFTQTHKFRYTFYLPISEMTEESRPKKKIESSNIKVIPARLDYPNYEANFQYVQVLWETSFPINVFTLRKGERLASRLNISMPYLGREQSIETTFPRKISRTAQNKIREDWV